MLSYLEQKKADLEARKVEQQIVYPDLDAKVEEYRKELYTARDSEIQENNKLIDAQVAILDEVIEETKKVIETDIEAEVAVETVGAVDEEQKEVEY